MLNRLENKKKYTNQSLLSVKFHTCYKWPNKVTIFAYLSRGRKWLIIKWNIRQELNKN